MFGPLATAATASEQKNPLGRGRGVVWSWFSRRAGESIRPCSTVPHGYNAPGLVPAREGVIHDITDREGSGVRVSDMDAVVPTSQNTCVLSNPKYVY